MVFGSCCFLVAKTLPVAVVCWFPLAPLEPGRYDLTFWDPDVLSLGSAVKLWHELTSNQMRMNLLKRCELAW
jgi:hypothetical protein